MVPFIQPKRESGFELSLSKEVEEGIFVVEMMFLLAHSINRIINQTPI